MLLTQQLARPPIYFNRVTLTKTFTVLYTTLFTITWSQENKIKKGKIHTK